MQGAPQSPFGSRERVALCSTSKVESEEDGVPIPVYETNIGRGLGAQVPMVSRGTPSGSTATSAGRATHHILLSVLRVVQDFAVPEL